MLSGAGIFLKGLSLIEVGASANWCASMKFSRSNPGEPDNCERKLGGKSEAFISVFKDTKPKASAFQFWVIIPTP